MYAGLILTGDAVREALKKPASDGDGGEEHGNEEQITPDKDRGKEPIFEEAEPVSDPPP